MGLSSLLLTNRPPPPAPLMPALLLLCLHLSEGFSYRGNIMRNRNRGGSNRGYLRNLGGGGRQRMGGMGFGKRAYGFDEPIEFYPDTDENGEDLFYPVYPDQEEEDGGEAEKRSLSSLRGFTGRRSSYKRATGEKPEDWNPEEKRGISSLKGKRGISSLKGKRAF